MQKLTVQHLRYGVVQLADSRKKSTAIVVAQAHIFPNTASRRRAGVEK
jgi:hypothetical protein